MFELDQFLTRPSSSLSPKILLFQLYFFGVLNAKKSQTFRASVIKIKS